MSASPMNRAIWVFVGCLLLHPRPLGAQKEQKDKDLEELLGLNFSLAAGRDQRLDDAPAIGSVITAEDIRRQGARTLEEALELVPGFEILTDSLGRGRIAVRGVVAEGSSANVLILFNGHRLNDHFNGGATAVNLRIPLYNVQKIEIIRGPGSALFGTNAFLAVINIITYTAHNFDGLEVTVGGGSFASQEYSLVGARAFTEWGLSGSFHLADTDGPDLLVPNDIQSRSDVLFGLLGAAPASQAPGQTAESRRSFDFSFNAAYKDFDFIGRVRDERSGGFIGKLNALQPEDSTSGKENRIDTRQILLGASQLFKSGDKPGDKLKIRGHFTYAQNEIREFMNILPPGFARLPTVDEVLAGESFPLCEGDGERTSLFVSFCDGIVIDSAAKSRRLAAEISFDYELTKSNQLTVGANIESESTFGLETSASIDPETLKPLSAPQPVPALQDRRRTVYSLFLQDTWDISPRLGVTAGLRSDYFSDFSEDTINPRAGLVWRMAENFHFKALYGRALRVPTISELFFDLPLIARSNPELHPSTVNTLEFQFVYDSKDGLRVSGNYFASYIRDFIRKTLTTLPGELGTETFINGPGLDVRGVEVEAKYDVNDDNSLFFNYTYQDTQDIQSGERTPDVPSHLLNLGATIRLGEYLSLTPTVLLRSNRPRSPLEIPPDSGPLRPQSVGGYGLVNLNVRLINLFEDFEISGTINNISDQGYFDPASFLPVKETPPGALFFPGDYPRPGVNAFLKVSYKF